MVFDQNQVFDHECTARRKENWDACQWLSQVGLRIRLLWTGMSENSTLSTAELGLRLGSEVVPCRAVKVLFLQDGVGEFTLKLAGALKAAGIIPLFVCTASNSGREHLSEVGVASYFLPMRSRLNLGLVVRLRRVILAEKPDILYCGRAVHCFNAIVAQFPHKSTKFVFYRGAIRRLNRLSPSDLLIFKTRWVDVFHCVCDAVAKALHKDGIPQNRTVTFPNVGIEISRFESILPDARLGPRKARYRVGAIANYRKVKGLEYLIDAVALLVNRGLDVELLIVGEDEKRKLARYASKCPSRDRVVLAGKIFPPWSVLKTFDCLAVPSLNEGLPKVVVEAFCCGVPVVATHVGGIPEMIEHNVNGLLVEPANAVKLADAIQKLLTDRLLASAFVAQARKILLERFEASVVSGKYVELFTRC